jgi:hypothetical protein
VAPRLLCMGLFSIFWLGMSWCDGLAVGQPVRLRFHCIQATPDTLRPLAAPRVARRAKRGGPGRTRTCNQTVMSGRISISFVDFATFSFDFARVCCDWLTSFLVRNWCGPSTSAERQGGKILIPTYVRDLTRSRGHLIKPTLSACNPSGNPFEVAWRNGLAWIAAIEISQSETCCFCPEN